MNGLEKLTGALTIPKIKNGSKVSVGKLYTVTFNIDHHFNWFQKKMIKWCFGLTVEDYTEELYYVKRKNQRKGKEWS